MAELLSLIEAGGLCVLSGAGISTPSGIPDYRGPTGATRNSKPIQYHEFTGSAETRVRYWARSAIGWPWIQAREPNAAHRTVAELESRGLVRGVITQNVDGLHQRAGSRNVVELHGTLSRVVCLNCGAAEARRQFQDRLLALNPGWTRMTARIAPDGDAELPAEATRSFTVPTCMNCRGVLKPDVVFFGESVPSERVAQAFAFVDEAQTLLVLGSSLTVFSGFRFVRHAARQGKQVAIINQGRTRADTLANVTLDAPLEEILPELAQTPSSGIGPASARL